MILVLGGSGTIGTEVVNALFEKKASGKELSVRVMVQDKDKARTKFGDKVDIFCGDLNNQEHLRQALKGVDRLFLLAPTLPSQAHLEKRIIEDAQRAGVRHIVKLSVYGADLGAESNSLIRWHADSENFLINSKIPYTIIRPNNFFSNLGRDDAQSIKSKLLEPLIVDEGKIYKCTQNAKLSFTHPKDIGEAAAKVLSDPIEDHNMCTYNITGPESLSYYELAERIGKIFNKKVEYVDLEDHQVFESLSKVFQDAFTAKVFVKLFQFYRREGASHVSGDFKLLTGKEPRSWDVYLRDNRSLFV